MERLTIRHREIILVYPLSRGSLVSQSTQNDRVVAFLDSHLAKLPNRRKHVEELWREYQANGLATAHFVKEFTDGSEDKFAQRVWELQLARHLSVQGYKLQSPEHGPDFRFDRDGQTIWVEAVSPSPKGLPNHWMSWGKPGKVEVNDVPHEEILRRWTAAFKEKFEKLKGYLKDQIVSEKDAYVIAISGQQLGIKPLECGISRLPFVIETVFPVGPVAFEINKETLKIENPHVSTRFAIRSVNGAPIPLTPFIDPNFARVSAVMGYSGNSEDANLPLYIAHNPFATAPVKHGWLGSAAQEWSAEPVGNAGEEMELKQSGKDAAARG